MKTKAEIRIYLSANLCIFSSIKHETHKISEDLISMQTYSNILNTNKTDALNLINRLKSRIKEKQKEIYSLELDIKSLTTYLNQTLQEDYDCFAWWTIMDSIVKKEKGWKDRFDYLTKKFLPEGVKEICCQNIEEKSFAGELFISFFYKERYFEFKFLAPGRRYYDVSHNFGVHTAYVYEKNGSPYSRNSYSMKHAICWSYDIDEIKNAPEKFLQENKKKIMAKSY